MIINGKNYISGSRTGFAAHSPGFCTIWRAVRAQAAPRRALRGPSFVAPPRAVHQRRAPRADGSVRLTDAVAAAVAGLVAALAVMVLLRFRDRLPHAAVSPRGLHGAPVPRVGGLAIWSGFMPVALVLPVPATLSPTLWAVPWLLLFAVSLVDDVKSVSVATRLGVHAIAAAWFAAALVHGSRDLAAGRGPCGAGLRVVAQSLQLHGRQRRPRGRDVDRRLRGVRSGPRARAIHRARCRSRSPPRASPCSR